MITPEQVIEAYKKIGKKPCRGAWELTDGRCCAVTALVKAQGERACFNSHEAARVLGLDLYYVLWFHRGFDGDEYRPNETDPKAMRAFRDGVEVRKAVFKWIES